MLSLYSLIWTFLISCPMLLLIFYSEKAIRLFNKVWSYVYFDSLHILYGKNAISDRISESSEGDM